MVQPSGRALTPFAGCMCSGFGVSVQGDTAEMPQAGMGWSAEEVGYPGAGGTSWCLLCSKASDFPILHGW